jgi:SAM-dependent methyltransferase
MTESPTHAARPKSTEEWNDIGRVPNLYYHILSWPDKRETGWTKEDFYATGVQDWADFAGHWRHYDSGLSGTCIEIGCGPGRLTCALAEDFDRVVGLDVSPEIIDHARGVVPENVSLELVSGSEIPVADGTANGVFSLAVLQHLETFEVVRGYLRESYRALAPGGSLMLNISLARRPRGIVHRARGELRIWRSRRGLRKGQVHEAVRWREYPWDQVVSALTEIGFENVQFRNFTVRTNGAAHDFWFATRPR